MDVRVRWEGMEWAVNLHESHWLRADSRAYVIEHGVCVAACINGVWCRDKVGGWARVTADEQRAFDALSLFIDPIPPAPKFPFRAA